MSFASFAAIAPDNLAGVTGGASGIGLAAARALSAAGMRVCLIDRDGDELRDAAGSIEGAAPFATDVDAADRLTAPPDRLPLGAHPTFAQPPIEDDLP